VCTHTSFNGHSHRRRCIARQHGRPGRQGDQVSKPRLSFPYPFLELTSKALKAEREREHQRNETQETHCPKDEQSYYRCDRIFYMAEWLSHLLSSVLGGTKSPPGLVNGCTKDLLDRFWVVEAVDLATHTWLTYAMQAPARAPARMPLLHCS
jgi:hypothetical protein